MDHAKCDEKSGLNTITLYIVAYAIVHSWRYANIPKGQMPWNPAMTCVLVTFKIDWQCILLAPLRIRALQQYQHDAGVCAPHRSK